MNMDLLVAARLILLRADATPYLSPLVHGLTPVVADRFGSRPVTTACVTGDGHMVWSPVFLEELRLHPDAAHRTAKIMLHEVVHVLVGHTTQDTKRFRESWAAAHADDLWELQLGNGRTGWIGPWSLMNLAAELQVNTIVDSIPKFSRITWPDDPPILSKYHGQGVREQNSHVNWVGHLATTLPRRTRTPEDDPDAARELWDVLWDTDDAHGDSSRSTLSMSALVRVAQQKATTHGSIPAGLLRLCQEVPAPRVPWTEQLRSVMSASVGFALGNTDYTYANVSRRQGQYGWGAGVRLPGRGGNPPKVAFILDTSGSISQKEIASGVAEALGVIEAVGGELLFISADCAVCDIGQVSDIHSIAARIKGGGGTSFIPGIEAAERERVDLIVYFTDGYGSFPLSQPRTEVVWLSTTSKTYPWGTVIQLEDL